MLPMALMALAIAITWWWIARLPIATAPVTAIANRIAFPGGLQLHDPEAAVAQLKNPDEIVIPHEHAVLRIDYPLSVPASIEVSSPVHFGFTRAGLVKTICEEYANVYETEEATAAIKPLALEERVGSHQGRNRTDGLYGIWGHDLQDLVLTAMRWTRRSDGTVLIELHVSG